MVKFNIDDFCADLMNFCSDAGIYLDCCKKYRENDNEDKCETNVEIKIEVRVK